MACLRATLDDEVGPAGLSGRPQEELPGANGEENGSKRNSRAAIYFANDISPKRGGGLHPDLVCRAGWETVRQDAERFGEI